jgi:hypothetical protein
MSGPGVNRLSRTMDRRMQQHIRQPVIAELAVVQSDMSLQCDHFGPKIPKGSYYIVRGLTFSADPSPMTGTNSVTFGDWTHSHTVNLPDQFSPLKPGDKVLVNWINDETIPVVVDVVVSS